MAATSQPTNDSGRQLLRHTVSTLAYRAGKTLRDVPQSFAAFSAAENCRKPAQILAHMGDLFDWALPSHRESRHGRIPNRCHGQRR
jgi:hypothetical protein